MGFAEFSSPAGLQGLEVSLPFLLSPFPSISHRDFELGQPRTTSNPFAVTASRVLEWQDGTYTDSSIRLVQAHLTHVSYIEGSVIHPSSLAFTTQPASQPAYRLGRETRSAHEELCFGPCFRGGASRTPTNADDNTTTFPSHLMRLSALSLFTVARLAATQTSHRPGEEEG